MNAISKLHYFFLAFYKQKMPQLMLGNFCTFMMPLKMYFSNCSNVTNRC